MAQHAGDIYLDSNATTRVIPPAAHEAHMAMEEMFGNPSSSHITGLRARFMLESTRKLARSVLGANSGQIIFTSGATEAIQMAVFSTLCQVREQRAKSNEDSPRVLLYGATEHKAVPQSLEHWNRLLEIDDEILAIPVDERGQLDLDFLAKHAGNADMVCTMAVNNETGVITDLKAVEQILRVENPTVSWMVDSVQAVGKTDLQLDETTIDYAPISGHKIHAPKGVGMLYVRDTVALTPLLAGGGQEAGARSGTENLPGAAALGAVFRCLEAKDTSVFRTPAQLRDFRDRLVASLESAFESIVFNTPFDVAVPTTINFSVQGFSSKEILDLFDAAGIRVSSGSACGSAIQGSYVLDAMGFPQWRSEGAIRLSFSTTNTERDIDDACRRIEEAGKALCDSCLVVSNSVGASPSHPVDGLIQLKHGSLCSWVFIDQSTRNCVVIDPIEEMAERIETLVRCQECNVVAVLDTHRHVDHRSCREMLTELLGKHAASTSRPCDQLGWPDARDGQVQLADGQSTSFIRLGGSRILVRLPLPGHTADGQAYLIGDIDAQNCLTAESVGFAFCGDTIQIGGLGRTDLPTSSPEELLASLRRLRALVSDATVICPTHDYPNGYCTTLGSEHAENPLLKQAIATDAPLSSEQFSIEKRDIDKQIDDDPDSELMCGFIKYEKSEHFIDLPAEELSKFFADNQDAMIVDVREPHEHRLTRDWDLLGLTAPPENVPLTRFTNFVHRLLMDAEGRENQQIICLCRSGNRSGKAAEVLRRNGIKMVYHMAGGIALGTRHEPQAIDADEMEFVI